MSSLFLASAQLVHGVISLFTMALLVRVVLSWVRPNPPPGFVRTLLQGLYGVTDPVLTAVRTRLPFTVVGGLDLSPILILFLLQFADTFLTGTLMSLA